MQTHAAQRVRPPRAPGVHHQVPPPGVCTGDMLTYCEHTMREICGQPAAALVEFNGQADQLHPLLAYPPVLISTLVPRLNGRTAHAVRREYTGRCNRAHMRGHP